MAQTSKVERLSFIAEWFDPEASIIWKFLLSYFPSDCTVEMINLKNNKIFLKRTQCEGLLFKDVFVGNTIKIFSRQIKIVDYADGITRKKMAVSMQRTFALIKPDGVGLKGEILCTLYDKGFQVSRLKMAVLGKGEASNLYFEQQGKAFYPYLLEHITSGPVIAMELLAEDAVNRLIEAVGPADPVEAKSKAAGCLRARFGQDVTRNVIHAAKSLTHAERESSIFFGSSPEKTLKPVVQLNNSTCCVIKPHAVQEGLVGKIVCMIEMNGYVVTALQLFYLDEINVEEFFEIYKGVVPEYVPMVKQLASGPCIAMEISSAKENCDVPVEFRKFVGPSDPEIAKKIRPNTIRAQFGKNKVENAVHVTDLPDDASLEVEYFFKILS